MNIKEEKREHNNELVRMYACSVTDKKVYLMRLIKYNYDLVSYTILKYFPDLKYHHDVYEVAVASLVMAAESYEMYMESDFEDYLVACMKDSINLYLISQKCQFICSKGQEINMGDIWYSRLHTLEEILKTKKIRDEVVTKEYQKVLKDNKNKKDRVN